MRFGLTKWYLDCVTPAGDAAVAYAGRVDLGRLSVPYVEVLVSHATGSNTRWRCVTRRVEVGERSGAIVLAAAAPPIDGRWMPESAGLVATLLDDGKGRIDWRCVQPGGGAVLRLPDGMTVEGLGYAERLDMTLAPWTLPFDELRWGRFVGHTRNAVWIDWRGGGLEGRWMFVDAAPVEAREVGRDRVAWTSGAVEIAPGRVLRDGLVGRSLLGPAAWCLPKRIARARETKWVAPATLRDDRHGHEPESGWVVHELVRWG